MQLLLKQTEIIAAVKQYVAQQGISLVGRDVTVTFTAGRGATGLSADVTISDAEELPDFVDDEPRAAPQLVAVKAEGPAPAEAAPADQQPGPATGKSLFG